MGQQDSCLYEFGPFRVDPLKRVLCRDGETLPLTSRAFDTLLTLVQNAGITVAKEEIIERVWGETVVEENNLTQCISALRKAFGEDRNGHSFIVTIPRQGYRFVAQVKPVSPEADIQKAEIGVPNPSRAPEQTPGSGNRKPKSHIQNRKWLTAAAVVLVGIGTFWLIKGGLGGRKPLANASAKTAAPSGRTILAVLPFENLTGDPKQDYFSDGFTEEVITQLGRLDPARLRVIAGASVAPYARGDGNIRAMGRDLGANYILEGSVRRSGDRVRISAQLVKASDQTYAWVQNYERPLRSVPALQEAVARDVEEHIAGRLDRRAVALSGRSGPVDPAVYQASLKGLYFFKRRNPADAQKAIDEFEAAIRMDRSYAPAYAGLADSYTLLALEGNDMAIETPKAQAAALKALALDPSLAESHTALAAVRVVYQWDWQAAEREFKLALSLNPNYELAHHWYAAFYLGPQGRYNEAIAEMKSAQQLDPVSLIVNTDLGWAYFIANRRKEAFTQYQETVRLNPRFVPVHYRLFEYYVSERMYPQALSELALDTRYSGDPDAAMQIAQEYRGDGFLKFLASRIEAQKQGRSRGGLLELARSYALLGESGKAIEALSELFKVHDPSMIYLKVDPELASLHSDPRFQDLERRCGLIP